jgi:hypothetical protein
MKGILIAVGASLASAVLAVVLFVLMAAPFGLFWWR